MIESEVRLSYLGIDSPLGPNQATLIVNRFIEIKALKKIGYTFDPKDLSDFDAKCFVLCEQMFNKMEQESIAKKTGR